MFLVLTQKYIHYSVILICSNYDNLTWVAFQSEVRNLNRMLIMLIYYMSCVVLTRPATNYVLQYLALNISSAVQSSRLYSWLCWEPRVVQSVLTVSESSWKCEIWRTVSWFLAAKQLTFLNRDIWLPIWHWAETSYQISLEILAGLETFIFIWLDFFVTNIYLEIDVYQRIKIFGIFYGYLKL